MAPTVYGNVLLGPTAEDIFDGQDTATTRSGIGALFEAGRRIVPALVDEEVTATYAGVRAATEHRDYQITVHDAERYACVGGIRSTGLTASLAIAEHVVTQMGEAGLPLIEAEHEPAIPHLPELAERGLRAFEDPDKMRADPAYGHIVCFCERVTEGEVRDALSTPVPAVDVGGVRRRTRATNGRCQGFYSRRGHRGPVGDAGGTMSRTVEPVDALVVGAGPAGLAAATALCERGAGRVVVVDREDEAGGTPRLCAHSGFGLQDLRRVLSGPAYARRWVARAVAAGADIRTRSMVTNWASPHRAEITGPSGLVEIQARAVVLATGARERPRPARLVPGTRPAGVFTTGQLQHWVHGEGLPVGRRALVVGAEHVSYSAVLTLREAGVRTVALVTDLPHSQTFGLFDAVTRVGLPRAGLDRDVAGRPLRTRPPGPGRAAWSGRRALRGRRHHRVQRGLRAGQRTGPPGRPPHRPGHPRARLRRRGCHVRAGFFAAGNVVHPAETADVAARRATAVGRAAAAWLRRPESGPADGAPVPVRVADPLRWVVPNLVEPGRPPGARVLLRSAVSSNTVDST